MELNCIQLFDNAEKRWQSAVIYADKKGKIVYIETKKEAPLKVEPRNCH